MPSALSPKSFRITLQKEDGRFIGHSTSLVDDGSYSQQAATNPQTESTQKDDKVGFRSVFDEFTCAMDLYVRFIPMTMKFAPMLSSLIAGDKIADFAFTKGTKIDEMSSDKADVFELDISHFREFIVHQNEIIAAMETTVQLPRVIIIGLISAYDYFLSTLLRLVLNIHEEVVLTSEKSIKFSDLSKYKSIEEARDDIISREVENVIRDSHFEQFLWMERTFSIKLREDLDAFPHFIELCERRNLFTHTGGIVSRQYLSVCKDHKINCDNLSLGSKLDADNAYFRKAVETVYEIGIKLNYVLWRKFDKIDKETADRCVNELGFDLIFKGNYALAERILAFTSKTLTRMGGNDKTRRMMLVNLANAIRLQGRKDLAKQIMEKEDWSATDDHFRICVAAVKEDADEVATLIRKIGSSTDMNKQTYRTWPVFRQLRTNEKIAQAFNDVFQEGLIQKGMIDDRIETQFDFVFRRFDPPRKIH